MNSHRETMIRQSHFFSQIQPACLPRYFCFHRYINPLCALWMNQYWQDDCSIYHLDLPQPRRMAGPEPTQRHSRLVSLQLGIVLLIFLAFVDQRGRFRSSIGSHGRCVPDMLMFCVWFVGKRRKIMMDTTILLHTISGNSWTFCWQVLTSC